MKNNYSCANCNRIFLRYSSTVRNPKRVFCCKKCLWGWQKEALKGKNNPGYKDGKYTDPRCKCGEPKDPRAKSCSSCTRTSFKKGTLKTADGWALAVRTDDELIYAVDKCRSIMEVAQLLDVSREWAAKRINALKVGVEHFKKCSHRQYTKKEILRRNSEASRPIVRKCVLDEDIIEYICCECGQLPEWNYKQLTLELHHINGDKRDNRAGNLVFLCPNCHTQTKNSRGKNNERRKRSSR